MLNLKLMGVINITPDSFSDGQEILNQSLFQTKVSSFQNAHILDLGAESTAPMNASISPEEELLRYTPYLDRIFSLEKVVSIDTYHPETISFFAKEWRKRGKLNPLVWNDISGKVDDHVLSFLSLSKAHQYVFCHNLAPDRMSSSDHMNYVSAFEGIELMDHMVSYFKKDKREEFILDPTFGFSKSARGNWFVLENMKLLQEKIKHPKWLIGFSRKSFLREKYALTREKAHREELDQAHAFEVKRLSSEWEGEVWLRTHRTDLLSV